ncbi:tRNA 2-selenouridine(34) synthase MnmH [Schnuerera sp. xch1]|uniref:tRNA 2-selenouridine(34) synthase MnmH n=1 Tax=Schnuerera sp. xch1 TaxID=2874283 RepID=UPI001CBF9DA9|nr:tRNA 2-selenouridine(34) synthase MnmH [Schnuerera sp. xch1]MBZ2174405.1 tRNA 2-selenouridine(34) synthase MnmH [Schnuerera sp. xch1]
MFKVIDYEKIDKNNMSKTFALIDVRSPSEYKAYTIPSAINIPIFTDDEREIVGTTYVQDSVEKAKRLGIEIASEKLPDIYDKFNSLSKQYESIILFCAKGGFRSTSLVSLFATLGMNVYKLDGGYKKYRKYINNALPNACKGIKFVVLYGNTGTGKTDILKALKEEGMDVLDLEGCANHRGSFFGSIGLGEQNTQKMFESLLYESIKNRKSNIIFTEGESKRIGNDIIPDYIFNLMKSGIHIKIHADIETRVNNILKDYVHDTDDELLKALKPLRKYLGNKNIDRYIEMVKKSKYEIIIEELMTKYYDPLYENKTKTYCATFYNKDSRKTAKEIIKWMKSSIINDSVIKLHYH